MKETKKAVARTAATTETVKTEAVKAEKAVKAAAVKAESTVKAAAEKAESTVKAAAEKAAPAAKATTAKAAATAKKATKDAVKTTVKTTTRKAAAKEKVTVQFGGKSYSSEELVKIAKDVWEYDLNQKPADFKAVELFVKPEESTVYYVINEDVRGSFRI